MKFHDLLQEHIFEAGEDASTLITFGSNVGYMLFTMHSRLVHRHLSGM